MRSRLRQVLKKIGSVVQLVRIRACHACGRGFESRPDRKKPPIWGAFSVMYFSYIIFSASSDVFYKGSSSNPQQRLWEHNNNLSHYTAGKGPWTLVYIKEFSTKREALIDEKRLKKLNRRSIELLIKEYLTLNGNLNP